MFSLCGKVGVVTGGAGWLGRQMVAALAEAGATIFIASRDLEKLQRQAGLFQSAGLEVSALLLDQGEERSVVALLESVVTQAGQVDVLVNNAALWPMADWSSPAADFARSMQVNATGMFTMTRAFGEYMAAHGGGSIINIGSVFGLVGPDFSLWEGLKPGGLPDYFFHKGGLLQLTRYAAARFGPHGVRVNMISPGLFFKNQDLPLVERAKARTFLRRMGNETDLKGAIVFLASDASAYVTGANLIVDGGYTVH